jgi:uridine kinase
MNQPGTSYRICVFRSPERYDDYHREYVEIPHPNFRNHMRTLDSYIENFGTVPNEPILRTIRLQRYRASLHISYDVLRGLGIDLFITHTLNLQESQSQQALLLTIFRKVSELTDRRVREEERDTPEHTIILDSVELVEQIETDRILVDLVIYACQHRDAELCQRYFQEYFYRLCDSIRTQSTNISNTETGTIRQIQRIGNEAGITQEDIISSYEWLDSLRYTQLIDEAVSYTYGKWQTWKPEAEEKALKLLESILSKGEFEIYKKDGYVMIEGKSHRMYKVKKGAMLAVSEKQKDGLYKDYRLCIEPKNYGTICPTDEVIAKVKLIQADENKLHEIAKKFEGK